MLVELNQQTTANTIRVRIFRFTMLFLRFLVLSALARRCAEFAIRRVFGTFRSILLRGSDRVAVHRLKSNIDQPTSTPSAIEVMNAVERDSSRNSPMLTWIPFEIQRTPLHCHCLKNLADSPNESTTQAARRDIAFSQGVDSCLGGAKDSIR